MIDIAKIADLVFLLIDGSFGFEMEIFEFLNICQVCLKAIPIVFVSSISSFSENINFRRSTVCPKLWVY